MLVRDAAGVSRYAAELSALSESELPALAKFLSAAPALPFRYVSVHAPVKDRHSDDREVAGLLDALPAWVRSIVLHPDLADLEAYRLLGTRAVLENMDDTKSTGADPDDMEEAFGVLPESGFCLDVAHAYAVDPSMGLAMELLDRFRSRLRQVHVSSLREGRHVALTAEDEEAFRPVLHRCRDVPWILEAPPPSRWAGDLPAAA